MVINFSYVLPSLYFVLIRIEKSFFEILQARQLCAPVDLIEMSLIKYRNFSFQQSASKVPQIT